jgi:hypothetical protein
MVVECVFGSSDVTNDDSAMVVGSVVVSIRVDNNGTESE